MYKFRQHVPSMCDGIDPLVFNFETVDELINSEYVQRFKRDDFHQYSVVYNRHFGNTLMVEFQKGWKWWVLGYILDENGNRITERVPFLPDWVPVREEQKKVIRSIPRPGDLDYKPTTTRVGGLSG